MKGLFCLFFALLPLQAQSLTWNLPQTLITYLGLTNPQAQQIGKNNDSYTELVAQKNARIWQVQAEISGETAKETLDPSALGVRYMEIELICRDIKRAGDDLRTNNLALLTDAQKVRLTALEEAMKLAPIYAAAQNANLLAGTQGTGFSGVFSIPAQTASWFVSSGSTACNSPRAILIPSPATNPNQWPCRDASCADKTK